GPPTIIRSMRSLASSHHRPTPGNPRSTPAMTTTHLSRRTFLASSAAVAAGASLGASPPPRQRKRIALIGTEVRRHSHAQHFIDRFLLGYAWQGGWRRPDVDLVSLYIDQFPERDLARATAARFDVPIY